MTTTKTSGLGSNFYAGGYDLSGYVNALGKISGGPALLDFTTIDKSAFVRQGGLRSGEMDGTTFFDTSTGGASPVGSAELATLTRSDEIMSYFQAPALGNPAACLNAKQLNFDPTRGTDGSLVVGFTGQSNGYGLEWGIQLTAGKRTDTSATPGTTVDTANGFSTPSVPASTTPVTNTTSVPASVIVSGGTVTSVSVNGTTAGSGDGTYTVGPGATIAITYSSAPTWAWTFQTAYGAQGYLHVFAFTGTSADMIIEHSADGTSWSTLIDFGAISAIGGYRATASGTIDRYLRASSSTGTFSSITFAVAFVQNLTAVAFL